jgi:hypothetical protein
MCGELLWVCVEEATSASTVEVANIAKNKPIEIGYFMVFNFSLNHHSKGF